MAELTADDPNASLTRKRLPVFAPRKVDPGTVAEPVAGGLLPARFTIVNGDDKEFLYVPEVQGLFGLPGDLARTLAAAAADSEAATLVREHVVAGLIGAETRKPLQVRDTTTSLVDLVVHPSQICNLACSYCYAHDINKANQVMSLETADAVVARAMAMTGRDGLSSVKFLGGEPTVAWDVVEYLVKRFEIEHAKINASPPTFVMVTNGTLWKPHMTTFAREHEMYLLVSLDGEAAVHDTLRPTQNGHGSYERASRTLKEMLAGDVDVAVESVYTRTHLDAGITPTNMIDHFLSFGVREMHITVPVGIWHEADTIDQIEEVVGYFEAAARRSVRSFRTKDPHVLRGVTSYLDGLLLEERRHYVCGAGRSFMAVNFDGEAFPCYLLESPSTSYGFVDKWDEVRHKRISQQFVGNGKANHEVCRSCWANELCQSCLGYSFQLEKKVAKPPAWFCTFNKRLIGAVLGEVAAARDSSDWDVFIQNMKASLLNSDRPFVPPVRYE